MSCTVCLGQGINWFLTMVSNREMKVAGPCRTCGAAHGYHDYVKNKYAVGKELKANVIGNLYAFPQELRNAQIYKEAGANGNMIPVKCETEDNVVQLSDYR